jgi:hypothetical protein
MSRPWRHLLPPLVRAAARPLDVGGGVVLAWPVKRAMQVVSATQRIPCAILGGDIFEANGERLVPAYANWSCDIERSETWGAYMRRSNAEAAKYLSTLSKTKSLWFVPICTLDPTAAQLLKSYAR